MAGEGRRRHRVIAARGPGTAATQTMRSEEAALQGAVPRHRFGGIGRAGRFVAAGANEEVGERQLVETDRPTQEQRRHAARKLAIHRRWRKPWIEGHGVATASAFSRL